MKRWKVHQRALCILNPVCVTIRGFVWAAIITKQRKCRFTFRYTISRKPRKKFAFGHRLYRRPVKPHWCWLGSVATSWKGHNFKNCKIKQFFSQIVWKRVRFDAAFIIHYSCRVLFRLCRVVRCFITDHGDSFSVQTSAGHGAADTVATLET